MKAPTHWGRRFDARFKCLRHGAAGCPSCLAYALGDAHDSAERLSEAAKAVLDLWDAISPHVPAGVDVGPMQDAALALAAARLDAYRSRHEPLPCRDPSNVD